MSRYAAESEMLKVRAMSPAVRNRPMAIASQSASLT